MTTVTVELPDSLADHILAYPAADRNDMVAEALENLLGDAAHDADADLVASLREGIADLDAGRVMTLEEADMEFDAAFEAARAQYRANITDPVDG